MKKLLLLVFTTISISTFSQEINKGRFYTATVYATFALNPDYVPFDKDDGESLLEPSAIFIRNGLGYHFTEKLVASVNFGIDFHTRLGIQSLPAYFNLRYNISSNDDDLFFINTSVGKLWKPSSNFDRGDYYSGGIGWQISGEKKLNTLIRLDYHRKKIEGMNDGNLDSISLGLGMTLF
ncbi:hypothetical protein [Urechidicola croceus]|uniref:Outer membrane protein beta-barrel domain-containing protein n=1 Tax=Urechidicola croceus TaxID=1850246 RepID=A0A1D8PA19_9FLAO|nr:hypothetical protein [Urechidicola croceus]AOW21430.1 hypothetical protein LPB138_12395 [Urechidicola croceus]